MSRKPVLGLAAAVTLAVAPSALGKEGPGPEAPVQICGASGCTELGLNAELPVRLGIVDESTPALASVAPAPYFLIGGYDVWVPSASALRLTRDGSSAWVATLPNEESVLREKSAGIQPYLPPTRLRVLVDFDIVGRSQGYLRLFTIGTPVAAAPARVTWLPVWFTGGRTPWDDGNVWMQISKGGSLLERDGQVFQISQALARRIRARLPLAP